MRIGVRKGERERGSEEKRKRKKEARSIRWREGEREGVRKGRRDEDRSVEEREVGVRDGGR